MLLLLLSLLAHLCKEKGKHNEPDGIICQPGHGCAECAGLGDQQRCHAQKGPCTDWQGLQNQACTSRRMTSAAAHCKQML
jgi:hypothetical protein